MKTPRLWLALLFLLLPTLARADLVCVQSNACCAAATSTGAGLTANTFTGDQTLGPGVNLNFGGTTTVFGSMEWSTVQTPDTWMVYTGSNSNTVVVGEATDAAFDYAIPALTDPGICVASHNQNTTDNGCIYHDGTDLNIWTKSGSVYIPNRNGANASLRLGTNGGYIGTYNGPLIVRDFAGTAVQLQLGLAGNPGLGSTLSSASGNGATNAGGGSLKLAGGFGYGTGSAGNVSIQTAPAFLVSSGTSQAVSDRAVFVAKAKALTAATATSFVRIDIPALSMAGGVVEYCIQASDGTDMQSMCGLLPFSVVNKAGTEVCTIGVTSTQNETLVASSTGTLTNTFTCDTTPTNGVDLQANAASSLTETILQIAYQIRLNGAVGSPTITPQ